MRCPAPGHCDDWNDVVFTQPVLEAAEWVGPGVEAGRHAGGEGCGEIAFDVQRLVEIRLEQSDVAAQGRRHHHRVVVHHERESRWSVTGVQHVTTGHAHLECDTTLLSQ